MNTLKFYSKLIFYSLVGKYYRKYMDRSEFFRIKGSSTWHSHRLDLPEDNLSLRDRLNLKRLSFGEELRKKGVYGKKTRINYTYYYHYYLCDIALGDLRKNGLQWITGMDHTKIKKLRERTDYSLNTYGKDNYKDGTNTNN